jgi:c-di-GMP-binding flagellar brake protein YcgR
LDDVGTWLTKMKQALSGEAEVIASIRKELSALQRSRAKVTLQLVGPNAPNESLASVIEHVRANDIVISQPSSGALTRPLAAGERVRIMFATSSGLNAGESRVIGRIKLPSGAGGTFFGYRLSIPVSLHTVDRREFRRIPMEKTSAPLVHLAMKNESNAGMACASASGSIMDISMGGMQVRLDGSAGPINPGSSVTIIADFPPPVGSINHPAKVVRFDHDPQTGLTRLGLQFEAPIPNLARFLSQFEKRSARRG